VIAVERERGQAPGKYQTRRACTINASMVSSPSALKASSR
jgi:hypothetical protein